MTGAASVVLHAGCALVGVVVTALILVAGRGRAALLPAAATAGTAAWAAAVALAPIDPLIGLAGTLEILRTMLWFALLLGLAWRFGGERVRPLALRFVMAGAVVSAIALLPAQALVSNPSFASAAVLARIALALMVILLAENLYRNTSEAARWHVNLPCIALGSLAAFDVLLYADAALSLDFSVMMIDARAALTGLGLPLLLVATVRDRRIRRDPPVSRDVVFHGATLVLAGGFLLVVGGVAELLRRLDASWGPMAQASLLAAAAMALAVAATTRSARSRLRRLVVDHFFTDRYDYRREWLRCVATLATPADEAPAVARAIRAIADAVDSPAGALLLRDPTGGLAWAGSWNAPHAVLQLPAEHPMLAAMRDGGWVTEYSNDAPADVTAAIGPVWLAVPLALHGDGLFGAVLLRPPRAAFATDREVFDLLRTLGREVAMFLAERQAAETLAEQRRVQDYAKRFAFVAHDVKTVSSQLSMLLANAEAHIDDPDFQRDMLLTVRASAERINALILRLRQPDEENSTLIMAGERLRRLLATRARPVRLEEESAGLAIAMPAEAFDTAILHLLNNAEEASVPDAPVRIRLRRQTGRAVIDITDQGPGMSAEFIRDELFRPFGTDKAGGSGIGAWQARDILRASGGDLVVLSHLGAGTTMRITVPLAQVQPGTQEGRA